MTIAEAQHRARQLGCAACKDERGWCLLLSGPGGAMVARGSEWEDTFTLLEKTAQRAPSCEWCNGAEGGCLLCANERGKE